MIAHLNLVALGRADCFAAALLPPPRPPAPSSVNGQHPGTLRGGFVEKESEEKKKTEKGAQVGGPGVREGDGRARCWWKLAGDCQSDLIPG